MNNTRRPLPAMQAFPDLDGAPLSKAHVRIMMVAGLGLFVAAYDSFIISSIMSMISWQYYGTGSVMSVDVNGWVRSSSQWGGLVGNVVFGVLGDIYGRKRMFTFEMICLMFGALLCAVAVWPLNNNPTNLLVLLSCWRFVLGLGIGGCFPTLAILIAEFAPSRRRGLSLAIVFAMQGLGILAGAVTIVVVLQIFRDSIIENGVTTLDYCWRLLSVLGIIPAIVCFTWRHSIPESPRFTAHVLGEVELAQRNVRLFLHHTRDESRICLIRQPVCKSFRKAFVEFFGHWSNLKVLVGCAASWFFLDVGYYGTSLNTPVVLGIIGYGNSTATGNQMIFDVLWNRAVGNVFINLCGTVPGYWLTVLFIERWGRKPIQFIGFTILTVVFLILAIWFDQLKFRYQTIFVVLYSLALFFFNFGPNVTTFVAPAEVFPTQVRSTAHGLSAAFGKAGAIIATQGFAIVARSSFGLAGVLFIFSSCCFIGLMFTFWIPETKGLTLEELSGDVDDQFEIFSINSPIQQYFIHEETYKANENTL